MSEEKEPIKVVSFIKIESRSTTSVIEALNKIDEIVKVQSITGEYDILIELETDTTERLYDIFAQKIDSIKGVKLVHSNYIMKTWNK